jgi:hypothetical protein
MKKIVLTKQEKKMLEKELKFKRDFGEYPLLIYTKDQLLSNSITKKAKALRLELNAFDEIGEDLIEWFWAKYQEQEQAENKKDT